MDDRRMDQSQKSNEQKRARALIGTDARAFTSANAQAFMLSQPSAARVAGLLALEVPPIREGNVAREGARAQVRESENTQTWRSPVSLASAMIFAILLALGLHSATRTGSLAAPASVSPKRFEVRSEESAMRKNPKSFAVAAAAALSVSFTATAQDAVQWRVEDGGNGHWYTAVATQSPIGWSTARDAAALQGGHLATLTSQAEDLFVSAIALGSPEVWPIEDRYGPWLGGYQTSPTADPTANWAWVTGEPWSYVSDLVQFDNSSRPDGQRDDYLHYIDHSRIWNDVREDGDTYYGIGVRSYIIEWSADCNSDGIVDFGQIHAGELDDANGNNIPDCCEAGVACACSADITGNGNVDAADLAAVLSAWGGAPSGKENADINGDGSIDAADLAGVLSAWGPCP
ncbi:MAG: hypothetical protein RL591_2063 [Planctomycetota bacterium]